MRRMMLISSAAAMLLAVALPMSAAAGANDRAPDARTDTAARRLEPIRLRCGVRTADARSVVRCEWSQPASDPAAAVRLFRFDPAVDPHRMIIYRSENLAATSFTDDEVRAGHRYAYALQVYDANGRLVGRSRAVWVSIPEVADHHVEVLKLACALGDTAEWIGCEWSRPVGRDAAVVSLWRSVDGGERELVERFRPAGPNAYRDAVPSGAHSVTYVVIATTDADRVVGRSRAETVRIPSIDDRPADTRPVEAQPVDTRSMGVGSP